MSVSPTVDDYYLIVPVGSGQTPYKSVCHIFNSTMLGSVLNGEVKIFRITPAGVTELIAAKVFDSDSNWQGWKQTWVTVSF